MHVVAVWVLVTSEIYTLNLLYVVDVVNGQNGYGYDYLIPYTEMHIKNLMERQIRLLAIM